METINTPAAPAGLTDVKPQADTRPLLSRPAVRFGLLILLLGLALLIRENGVSSTAFNARFQTFVTIFLSIFIEAAPFLLAGSLVSGLLEIFVSRDLLYRFIPRNPISAALMGGSLGLVFPVCECGVVPVTRRLYQKGLPISMGIAFMLSAPVINPVVFASTYAAFGWGPILWGRFLLTFVIASLIGLLFYLANPKDILLPEEEAIRHEHEHDHDHHHHDQTSQRLSDRFWAAMRTAGDDFIDMSRYLIAGSMLAASMQTLVPQNVLLALGGDPLTSIVALMALAFVLSVCSTVDAFLALAFQNTFPPAAILSFLVFGPMVDIKSALMFLGIFKRRVVLYLILLPLLLTLLITLYMNLNVRW